MKSMLAIFSVVYCSLLYSQTDYWANQLYFSGCPINHIPKGITIPDKDKKARAIINAIIEGYSYDELLNKFPDSLDIKLNALQNGKVIEQSGKTFNILFPVFITDRREKLKGIIHRRVYESQRSINDMLLPLKSYFSKNPEMIFHFLWSRIMDDCWWPLYNTTFQTEKGPPSIAMLIHPPHPFQCGTNSDYSPDNDMFAFTWSYNLFDDTFIVPRTQSFMDLAAGKPVTNSDSLFFIKHGLLDSDGSPTIFTYTADDSLDRLCDSLKGVYIGIVKNLFDYNNLSEIFQTPVDDLFIVVSHEIAYEFIQLAYERNLIFLPTILKNNPGLNMKYLVSIRYFKETKKSIH